MAVTIQEPASIPRSSITPESEDRYHVLVYEQAQDDAGIKRLRISDWKNYLGYNTHKVDNLESYTGMDPNFPWDSDADMDYDFDTYGKPNLTLRIENLKDKLGVSYNDGVISETINAKLNRIEQQINGNPVTTPTTSSTGIQADLNQAILDIQSLEDEIGDASGSQNTLTERVGTLEQAVNGDGSTTGLRPEVNILNTTIFGDSSLPQPTTGLQGDVGTLQNEVTALNTAVGIPYSGTDSLANRMDAAETDISTLNTAVGTYTSSGGSTISSDIAQLKQSISSAYTVQGDIYGADGSSSSPTTLIYTAADLSESKLLSELGNGWVYNINAPSVSIWIDGEPDPVVYTKGSNIVWIKPEGGDGYFDELGTAIDVTRITTLETKVTALENKFKTDAVTPSTPWSSTSVPDGIYTFSTKFSAAGGTNVFCMFSAAISNGSSCTPTVVDSTGNFSSYFNIDNSTLVITSNSNFISKVNYIKIGEI